MTESGEHVVKRARLFFCYIGRFGGHLLVVGESDRGRVGEANAVSRSEVFELSRDPDHLSKGARPSAGQPHRIEEAFEERVTLLAERFPDGEKFEDRDNHPGGVEEESQERVEGLVQQQFERRGPSGGFSKYTSDNKQGAAHEQNVGLQREQRGKRRQPSLERGVPFERGPRRLPSRARDQRAEDPKVQRGEEARERGQKQKGARGGREETEGSSRGEQQRHPEDVRVFEQIEEQVVQFGERQRQLLLRVLEEGERGARQIEKREELPRR